MASQTIELGLIEKGGLVESLWHAVDSTANLDAVPGLVQRVLETNAWQKRVYKGKTFEHERFIDFIVSKPLAGCGWSPEKVEALIKDDAATLTLWRDAITPSRGGDHLNGGTKNNNIIIAPQGTSRAYTLSRLKRENEELFERVIKGELSANAAAIEAGFRKKYAAFEQVTRLIPKLSDLERADLIQILERWGVET
jgi:hypothetical protein